MNKWPLVIGLIGLLAGSDVALARGHVGVMIDVPLWPAYYPGPYYHPYYPPAPVVVVPAAPPVYIEQTPVVAPPPAPVQSAPQPAFYWYHCAKPEGYYPYVRECPAGWVKVLPQPPGQ